MRFLKMTILTFSLLLLGGCNRLEKKQDSATVETRSQSEGPTQSYDSASKQPHASAPALTSTTGSAKSDPSEPTMQRVSLQQADQSQTVAQAVERKIIKDGELTLEVPSPTEAQRQVTSIAESHNGYVVTSESKQQPASEGAQPRLDITLVLRVPSAQFGVVYDQIQGLSKNITQQKQTGQDVTEEFIDLEAHIRTQKALETQFLEIMKQAHKVEDALEVQRQIAGVRADIEKLEGRKRFLENRSSLSTITVNLKQTGSGIVVNTSGFGRRIKDAVSESIDVAGAIILFLIQFVIVMIPIFLLLILPIGLVLRYFVRRARRYKLAREIVAEAPSTATGD